MLNEPVTLIKVDSNIYSFSLNCFTFANNEQKAKNLQSIIDQTSKDDILIAHHVVENGQTDTWLPQVKSLMEQRNCKLILDMLHKGRGVDVEATYIDFYPLRTYFETEQLKKGKINKIWNPSTNQFLFLTGKPNSVHRVGLLKKFLDQTLEKNCIWSFFVNEKTYKSTQAIIGLSDDQFAEFVKKYSRSPDHVAPLNIGNSMHYGGFPYDHTLYEQTSFRVISESEFVGVGNHITEKSWVTIANHHPFIMAGNLGGLARLRAMDIQTFERYQDIPDYDTIDNYSSRLDAIVHNAKIWLETIEKHQKEIQNDIEHNIKVYHSVVKRNESVLAEFCSKIGIDVPTIYRSGLFSDIVDMQWLLFYNKIKDSSWPDCLIESNFCQLPNDIKKEVIDVFGYCPTNNVT